MVQKLEQKRGIELVEGKEIKKMLIDGDHTLKWLWRQVRETKYRTLAYTRFCEIINGSYLGGYAPDVLKTAKRVLDEQKFT
jgi:hypothetical protein